MNKKELIEVIAKKTNISKADTRRILDALISSIVDGLKVEDRVTIAGFGTFSCIARKAGTDEKSRKGTSTKIEIKFKAANSFHCTIGFVD